MVPVGLLGVTHVEEAGVRRGGGHGLDIVGVGFRQRSFDDAGSGDFCGAHSGFVAGIGSDVAFRRGSE